MFKSNSQWMQHKTTVEFFDSQQEFIAEVAGRYDPEHKQGEYFKMSMEHLENLGNPSPAWDGLGYGTQEERYHLGMDLIQSGSQNKNLIANLQNQSTNVKVTTTMNVGTVSNTAPKAAGSRSPGSSQATPTASSPASPYRSRASRSYTW